MNKLISRYLVFAMLLGFAACSSPPDKLGSLDLVKWRGDRGGCNDVRAGLEKDFKTVEPQLKGKFADDIGDLLGRPDIHQLGERNQKFYVYFLSKGEQCDDIKAKSNAPKVILKFNAVGLLSEITYQSRPL
ncbi:MULTISPECIES: hypothetical protein [Dyadobacter]|jgi:hypothetical protein|uniref:Lipoprotein n=1 Tax=Dyadobacter chenhuakuii TaxID=2909339 RepID=A0A9X1QG74_9BACT|nr:MULTISPECIES: hypothetical protein [Dyadobacter]MCE7068678.1 hypothetical protein [Dyadobacter sp. CY327]MCF2499743.1 hypothetical protein [Dyadobacter chenhuakuii]